MIRTSIAVTSGILVSFLINCLVLIDEGMWFLPVWKYVVYYSCVGLLMILTLTIWTMMKRYAQAARNRYAGGTALNRIISIHLNVGLVSAITVAVYCFTVVILIGWTRYLVIAA
jgi:hypothetical protein